MRENIHYKSMFFKELHKQEDYWHHDTYRAGAAVVPTIDR